MTEFISVTDTAKLIRKALKREFQGFKFSVRSSKYAGGASIDISWTDGPTSEQVDSVTDAFAGKGFDGSIDLAYRCHSFLTEDGRAYVAGTSGTAGSMGAVEKAHNFKPERTARRVSFGADYIFSRREISIALQSAVLKAWPLLSFGEKCRVFTEVRAHSHCRDFPTSFSGNGEGFNLIKDDQWRWIVRQLAAKTSLAQ